MVRPEFNFRGKVAVVTGGASGMGRKASEMLAAAGARVLVADLNEGAAREVAGALDGAEACGVNVGNPAQVNAMLEQAQAMGGIDLLFNNAGIMGAHGPLAEATNEDYDRTFDVNMRGAFLCMSGALRQMIANKRAGAIVNTASIAGLRGVAGVGLYSASKFAVIGLTRSAAKEAGPHGIRVNAICPGATLTNFADMSDSAIAQTQQTIPLGRIATVEDMAVSALWLMSDAAAFLNGVILPVDGGQTA